MVNTVQIRYDVYTLGNTILKFVKTRQGRVKSSEDLDSLGFLKTNRDSVNGH